MFRLVFLTFFGKARNEKIHAHESPKIMTIPLWILAIGSIAVGLPGSPWMHHWIQGFLHTGQHAAEHVVNPLVMGSSILAGLGGILLTITGTLGGHLSGNPTAVSRVLHFLGWDVYDTFYLPDWVLLLLAVAIIVLPVIGLWGRRRPA